MYELAALFLCFYVYHLLGITIGYHRLLAHRSFQCPKAVEYFFVLAGYLGFQSSPIWWATIHRAHHRFVDTERDAHSPRYGIWNSAFAWAFKPCYTDVTNPSRLARDLISDPFYLFLEQGGDWRRMHICNSFIGFSSRAILLCLFGWKVAVISVLAGLAAQVMPFLLNVVCHMPFLGYRNYETGDDSVNCWWVAVLTAGEGWHNNHHKVPGSAKSGLRWFEIDVSWMVIDAMSHIGLVTRINRHSSKTLKREVARARVI